MTETERTPAVPPEDYKGSIAEWCVGLRELGWNEEGWYGDFEITTDDWVDLRDKCEPGKD